MSTDKLPQNYDDLKEALDKLFPKWEKELKEKFGKGFKFLEDGALPGYPHQKLKILYLGQEAHGNDPKELMRRISTGEYCRLKTHTFRRAVLFAYGLINNKTWKEVEKWRDNGGVKEWKDNIKTPEKPNKELSFAFMNASKFAHLNGNGSELSENFENYARESLDFTREEIDLINPDLIISWNIRGAFKTNKNGDKDNGDCFLRELTGSNSPEKGSSENVRIWTYTFNKIRDASTGEIKQIPLLDTWHFCATKRSRDDTYNPIRKALKKLGVI